MLSIQDVTYVHPDKDVLFNKLNLTINNHTRLALIGNNGAGKSTLLKLLARELLPFNGVIKTSSLPYYVPQHFGQFDEYSVGKALRVHDKLNALKELLNGNATEEYLELIGHDWDLEERCKEALSHWKLNELDLDLKMKNLSGGQKTKVFLAGVFLHKPKIVLLDEPSNNLDHVSRHLLYEYIQLTKQTLVVVSHDKTLLNLLDLILEIHEKGINSYGGNYDFYIEQKKIEKEALDHDIKSKEKALRKAKETGRKSLERKEKLDARGKKKQEKSGLPEIMMNTLKNKAERSTSRIKDIHTEKTDRIFQDLNRLREELPDIDKMKMQFDNSTLHKNKVLFTVKDLNFSYNEKPLWKQALNFKVLSGERLSIKGTNGSGKTSLLKLILGQLETKSGTLEKADFNFIYLDQDYSLIDNSLTVYQQAEKFNTGKLQEHEIKLRLNRFLFKQSYWDKYCVTLSGGEKMRLMLCSLSIGTKAPDLIVLDEPTNNLDIQNTEILISAINEYKGTLLVVSHDAYFLKQISVENYITLTSEDYCRLPDTGKNLHRSSK